MADIAIPRRLPGLGPVLATQIRYQLTMILRTPRALIAGLLLPGALLALERGNAQQHITMALAAPKVAGLVSFSAVAIAFFTHANALVIAREDGVLRRWHAAPLPTWGCFAARIAATTLLTVASGLILVLVAMQMAGLHLSGRAIPGLLAVGVLGALALSATATLITTIIPSTQAAQPVLMLIYIPLIILSGSLGSLATELPHWLTETITYLPVQPIIDSATRVLEHPGGTIMSVHDLAVLAAWAAGTMLVSLRFFRWDPTRQRHARPRTNGSTARSE
jgi:ABC-2 type transport system permease protein